MDKRIIELEKKAAFQENLLTELNKVLFEQQKKLERLENKLKALEGRMDQGDLVKPQEDEDRPPHY